MHPHGPPDQIIQTFPLLPPLQQQSEQQAYFPSQSYPVDLCFSHTPGPYPGPWGLGFEAGTFSGRPESNGFQTNTTTNIQPFQHETASPGNNSNTHGPVFREADTDWQPQDKNGPPNKSHGNNIYMDKFQMEPNDCIEEAFQQADLRQDLEQRLEEAANDGPSESTFNAWGGNRRPIGGGTLTTRTVAPSRAESEGSLQQVQPSPASEASQMSEQFQQHLSFVMVHPSGTRTASNPHQYILEVNDPHDNGVPSTGDTWPSTPQSTMALETRIIETILSTPASFSSNWVARQMSRLVTPMPGRHGVSML
ncbi:hypothetical protein C8R43DRAFT_955406 [Mycena crocata]|nr:hypothetical protein C8R43DRAFT_955406 [Mycena crocata]